MRDYGTHLPSQRIHSHHLHLYIPLHNITSPPPPPQHHFPTTSATSHPLPYTPTASTSAHLPPPIPYHHHHHHPELHILASFQPIGRSYMLRRGNETTQQTPLYETFSLQFSQRSYFVRCQLAMLPRQW